MKIDNDDIENSQSDKVLMVTLKEIKKRTSQ